MHVPPEFTTRRGQAGATRPIVVRPNLDGAETWLGAVSAVDWSAVHHAYGPASDVPGQLAAVIVGDDETRDEAWWNLWGNIHHQGTIYEATAPAVPILLGLAAWREHPDRAQALLMLREIAAAPGELRRVVAAGAAPILDGWRTEPANVQRALLWLLSVDAGLRAEREDLVAAVLPERHRRAWELEIAGSADSEEEEDAVVALEDWVHSGAA
jgi:hypothetical protein